MDENTARKKKNIGDPVRQLMKRGVAAMRSALSASGWRIHKERRDFSHGPVWDEELKCWLDEMRYPDGSRKKKRSDREADAWNWRNGEHEKIRNGTWNEKTPKNITFGKALDIYRDTVRDKKSFEVTADVRLRFWEREIPRETPLGEVAEADEWLRDILRTQA